MLNYNYYKEKINKSLKLSDSKKEYYLEIAKKLDNLGFPIILNSYHLSNLAGINWNVIRKLIENNVDSYHRFYITKKDKISKREILAPSRELLYVQRYIKKEILSKVIISPNAYGFVEKRSIRDNANAHLNSEAILNLDLKDFFPSISAGRVYYIFNKICQYDKTLSYCLTKLVTYRNMLPQGAATSPIISNIVSYKLDLRLSNLALKNDIKYTRYADDITFSGSSSKINNSFLKFVSKIVSNEGFCINNKKVRFCYRSSKCEVTGLIINNGKISVNSKYVARIRQELYYIKKFGLQQHIKNCDFRNSYYLEHLKGKIMFVWSIDRKKGEKFLKEFNQLNLEV